MELYAFEVLLSSTGSLGDLITGVGQRDLIVDVLNSV